MGDGSMYGQIAGNQAINAMIYRCFVELEERDQQKFVTRFQQQLNDPTQVLHTFRELILGAYLHTLGFGVRSEPHLQDKTPDWLLEDAQGRPQAVVELVNFHIDYETEKEIQRTIRVMPAVVSYRRDENADNPARLYYCLQKKMAQYRDLMNTLGLAYIVAVFGSFEAALDAEEVMICLAGEQEGLFTQYPHVSGVLFFGENGDVYSFQYFENPVSLRKLEIVTGVFSLQ